MDRVVELEEKPGQVGVAVLEAEPDFAALQQRRQLVGQLVLVLVLGDVAVVLAAAVLIGLAASASVDSFDPYYFLLEHSLAVALPFVASGAAVVAIRDC